MPGEKRKRYDRYSPHERLMLRRHINQETGCWEFTGCLTKAGYGQIRHNKKVLYTHHVSFEYYCGDRKNNCVLHKCDNPMCFNPEHLFLGTHRDNMIDMTKKGRNKGLLKINGSHSRWESVRASAV